MMYDRVMHPDDHPNAAEEEEEEAKVREAARMAAAAAGVVEPEGAVAAVRAVEAWPIWVSADSPRGRVGLERTQVLVPPRALCRAALVTCFRGDFHRASFLGGFSAQWDCMLDGHRVPLDSCVCVCVCVCSRSSSSSTAGGGGG